MRGRPPEVRVTASTGQQKPEQAQGAVPAGQRRARRHRQHRHDLGAVPDLRRLHARAGRGDGRGHAEHDNGRAR
ncbi:hypothetical protein Aph02nite_46210 [Actinoplanes philippinensis]|nr:hypothetical protein Aph02nite_46210 [Actinoplanes philippinensis]